MTTPLRPRRVKDDLAAVLARLIEQGIADDQNFPIVRPVAGEWHVSFAGAEYISIALGDIEYNVIYRELSDRRSYSAKLIDGGLLQLMYSFRKEKLIKHRLAYLPSPHLPRFADDADAYLRDELYLEIVSRRIVPFPLRFDFDESAATSGVHPSCHLTLGDVKGCRIPVSAPLTPRWFIEFILRNFYQTEKRDFVTGLPGHVLQFDPTITAQERGMIHVEVPVGLSAKA